MAQRAGLADVLRAFGPAYRAAHALSPAQARAWRAIVACRTAALGGHVERCGECGATRHIYRSCRNRHCPLCQTRAKEAWLAARQRELLPVPYFHLVFTLPHALNALAARCGRVVYELLFGAASATLVEFAANPRWLGGVPAFTLVLHTWKQDLGRHIHAHALVAGGALTAQGEWRPAKQGFLFPVHALSTVFRGKFIAALTAQRGDGPLRADGALSACAWDALIAQLRRHAWVVYAKQPLGGPAQVLEYLGRYTHRTAISNERLLGMGAGSIRLRVRDPARPKGRRVIDLPADVFIGRFLSHVLPTGFKRIRHYGLLGPAKKAAGLSAARTALGVSPPQPAVIETVEAFMRRVAQVEWARCPYCNAGRFTFAAAIAPVPPPSPIQRGPP
ncbi:MAG TPA: IS91 family transposase [Verrucomicrobiae bacterium]|nr:IS91 family transposase [Verrucomicrobiae bacterium]